MHLSSRRAAAGLGDGIGVLPGAGSAATDPLPRLGAAPLAAPWLVHDAALRRCIEGHANAQAWRAVLAAQRRFAAVLAVPACAAAARK